MNSTHCTSEETEVRRGGLTNLKSHALLGWSPEVTQGCLAPPSELLASAPGCLPTEGDLLGLSGCACICLLPPWTGGCTLSLQRYLCTQVRPGFWPEGRFSSLSCPCLSGLTVPALQYSTWPQSPVLLPVPGQCQSFSHRRKLLFRPRSALP